MYLETIIDIDPNLQIIYYYELDVNATVLEAPWSELNHFCKPHQPYELMLERYNYETEDVSQNYYKTDLKTWVDHLPNRYKQELVAQFVSYCEQCQPNNIISIFK
jgi:hypothetical protein